MFDWLNVLMRLFLKVNLSFVLNRPRDFRQFYYRQIKEASSGKSRIGEGVFKMSSPKAKKDKKI